MNKENKLIIEQINKFGKVPETYELLQTIKELENINEKLSLALESAENKIDKAIEYIQNHQLVCKKHTTEEIDEWFNQFYVDVMQILKEVSE